MITADTRRIPAPNERKGGVAQPLAATETRVTVLLLSDVLDESVVMLDRDVGAVVGVELLRVVDVDVKAETISLPVSNGTVKVITLLGLVA
ncbi:hypothetical protein FOPE_07751 [Fonsecaea pedrosoi]|nr:hypothetical protein FOPE_07751 [Fonsecaea pedrosoi]